MKQEPRKRVLVVDDETDVTDLLVRILGEHGYETWALNNPLKVLELAAQVRPDLILLDFDMPTQVGSEVAVLLRSAPETRNVPVIFCSGMTDDDHRVIAAMSGGVAYLEKPIDPRKLIEIIRGLIGVP